MYRRLIKPKFTFRRLGFVLFTCFVFFLFYQFVKFISYLNNRNVSQYSYALNFSFVYNPVETCSKRAPYLLIVIKSRVDHFEHRQVLRETWAKQQEEYGLVERMFSLGLTKENINETSEINRKLRIENLNHGDIVQSSFIDDYYNNTLKMMMGIRWACEYCPKVDIYKYKVLKLSDVMKILDSEYLPVID